MSNKSEDYLVHVLAMVEESEADPLTCVDADALLPEFHQAMQLQMHDQPRWQSLLRHLRTCPACVKQLALLIELDRYALGEAGAEPNRYPAPDLLALRRRRADPSGDEAAATKIWHVDRWGRIIIELSERALHGRYDVPAQEDRQPLAGLAEGSAAFRWEERLNDLDLSIEITPCLSSPGNYDLSIRLDTAEPVSRSLLASNKIAVYWGAHCLATAAATVEDVMAIRVPSEALDQLRIEIDPA